MKMRAAKLFSRKLALAGLLAVTAVVAVSQFSIVTAQSRAQPVPGGTAATDQVAWMSFVRAIAPSGQQGKVAYETWASDQDIYVARGASPTWPSSQAAKSLLSTTIGHHNLARAAGAPVVGAIGPNQVCSLPGGDQGAASNSGFLPPFPNLLCVGEEVRRDRASFDYIVSQNLWSKSGLSRFFRANGNVEFPQGALNVKADWIPVSTLATWLRQPESFVTTNFYTALGSVQGSPSQVLMAMTSMHVAVKDWRYPPTNWVWANFENAYTPGRCDLTGCIDHFGAAQPVVPPNGSPWGQYGQCAKTPSATAMLQSANVAQVFNNYCLTGTQVEYGTAANPTLLGSPIIETLNANVPMARSSCTSCHTAAAFNRNGTPPFSVLATSPIGPLTTPAGFKAYDFMWGVINAQ